MFNLNVIRNRKIWLSLSSILIILSVLALFSWGLNFGIDFRGGSLLEIKFNNVQPTVVEVQEELRDLELNSLTIQPTDNNSIILRFKDDSSEKYQEILFHLEDLAQKKLGLDDVQVGLGQNFIEEGLSLDEEIIDETEEDFLENLIIEEEELVSENLFVSESKPLIEELRFELVGPTIGKELKSKSFNAIALVLIIIIIYVALVFKKISKPVSSWKYGIASVIALFHDVLIVLGVFAVLGRFYGTEINTPFIAAILTVLGYSINDTIIIFDRIRENLPKSSDNFMNTINKSINQTLTRSIYTSTTTLLALLSIIIFGGGSIREFVLALAIGIFVGTYSSIFLASPILVLFDRRRNK